MRVFLNTNMKQELYKTILNKFKNNGKILFFNNKFYFNGINNFDDLLIKGNLKTKKPQAISILFRHKQPQEVNDNKKENIKLVQTNESLTDVGAITSIFFEKQTIKDIQRVIKKSNSTYLRIFNNEKNIQISIFDYRQFIPRTRLLGRVGDCTSVFQSRRCFSKPKIFLPPLKIRRYSWTISSKSEYSPRL